METVTAQEIESFRKKRSRQFQHCRFLRIMVIMSFFLAPGPVAQTCASDSIRIASIFAHSGAAASSNIPSILGVRWAIEEINHNGGILGRPIALIEIDNLGTPIGSKVAAKNAISQNVTGIFGPAWSTHALAAARAAQDAGVPMISNVATHPQITRVGNFIYRACYNDLYQGRVLGQFTRQELKAEQVVILQDISSDYSLGLAGTFKEAFEWFGGSVVAVLDYKASCTCFEKLLAEAKRAAPDAVFLPGHDESGAIIAKAQRMGLQVPFIGGDGWDVASFFEKGGNELVRGYYATHWSESVQTPQSLAFSAKHKNSYPFLSPAALSYDAVYLLADAIVRAGSTNRSAVRDALAQTRDFEGITGSMSFNADGDPIKNVVIMEISHGQPAYLKYVQPVHLRLATEADNDTRRSGQNRLETEQCSSKK